MFYTDGSVDPYPNSAAAAYVRNNGTVSCYRLLDGFSTLQTEFRAIQKTLLHADTLHNDIVIHTDSLANVQTLKHRQHIHILTNIYTTARRIQSYGKTIHINWIPNHAGIAGNEVADQTAKDALSLPTVTANIPESLSQTKAEIRKKNSTQAKQELITWTNRGSYSAA